MWRRLIVVSVISGDVPRDGGARPPATWVPDLVGAAIVTGLMVLISSHLSRFVDDRELDALGYTLVVAGGGSLVLCRRWPRLILGIVVAVLGIYVARQYPNGPVFAAGWVALFVLSRRTDRRSAVVGAGVLCGVLGLVSIAVGRVTPTVPLIFIAWSAVAALLGDALRHRRSALAELQQRARDLERTREEETRRRVAEDRLSIARDLHDSVAHAMATINVQSGAAAHVVDRRPEAAKEALVAIQRASGDVLDELAVMLALLRDDCQAADRGPTPSLERLGDLVEAGRNAHVSVSLRIHGATSEVPKPVGIAAYRIVQESLTNVVRHASASSAVVTVHIGANRSLTVEVCDDGTGRNGSSGTGMGIPGMRERAEMTGGRLDAHPRPEGGFVVRATWDGAA
jgi:signal transduction histidine kinase